jgi:hypothetical protein
LEVIAMLRRLSLVLVLVLLAGSAPLRADSSPAINGEVSGLELCEQAVCGAAIFVGVYHGRVGFNPFALGLMSVAVTHEDLPEVTDTAAITGGVWRLRLLSGRLISGIVTGGVLENPRGDDTFDATVELLVTSGGSGTLTFEGLLDHTVFPPAVSGSLGG